MLSFIWGANLTKNFKLRSKMQNLNSEYTFNNSSLLHCYCGFKWKPSKAKFYYFQRDIRPEISNFEITSFLNTKYKNKILTNHFGFRLRIYEIFQFQILKFQYTISSLNLELKPMLVFIRNSLIRDLNFWSELTIWHNFKH